LPEEIQAGNLTRGPSIVDNAPHWHEATLKITGAKTILFTAPWTGDPFWRETVMTTALVQVFTDEGITGLGETSAGQACPEALPALVETFGEWMIGMDPTRPEVVWEELQRRATWWARVGLGVLVLAGVEMALWDIAGKAASRPVYDLLGGAHRDRQPVYASGTQANWPPGRGLEHARWYVDQGFSALKLATGYLGHPRGTWHAASIHERAAEEYQKFSELRQALGPGIELALDSHTMELREPWDRRTPLAICHVLEELHPLFYEEPLRYEDVSGYAELRRATRVPIAGGEGLSSLPEFQQYLDAQALDYVQPDSGTLGVGLCHRVARAAANRHVGTILHSGGVVGPGLMANLHVALASAQCPYLEYVLAFKDLTKEFMVEPLIVRDGSIAKPVAPGLGVRLPDGIAERYPFRHGFTEVF
jgi:L-alanine-DL-glutamate epimerase-like enolase superfamily enzyme